MLYLQDAASVSLAVNVVLNSGMKAMKVVPNGAHYVEVNGPILRQQGF